LPPPVRVEGGAAAARRSSGARGGRAGQGRGRGAGLKAVQPAGRVASIAGWAGEVRCNRVVLRCRLLPYASLLLDALLFPPCGAGGWGWLWASCGWRLPGAVVCPPMRRRVLGQRRASFPAGSAPGRVPGKRKPPAEAGGVSPNSGVLDEVGVIEGAGRAVAVDLSALVAACRFGVYCRLRLCGCVVPTYNLTAMGCLKPWRVDDRCTLLA